MDSNQLSQLLADMSPSQRSELLQLLRQDHQLAIHPLERNWGTSAEVILEAIDQAPDLIQRGVRGVVAEAIFRTMVVPQSLPDWFSAPVHNDAPYDLLLSHPVLGDVRVQVKSQRKEKQLPKLYKEQDGPLPVYVVETQRTRNGVLPDGTPSRPYRFEEFDVLAVCLHASSGRWDDFIYCATPDLLARSAYPNMLEVLQPVYLGRPQLWSRDFPSLVLNNLRNRQDGRKR